MNNYIAISPTPIDLSKLGNAIPLNEDDTAIAVASMENEKDLFFFLPKNSYVFEVSKVNCNFKLSDKTHVFLSKFNPDNTFIPKFIK